MLYNPEMHYLQYQVILSNNDSRETTLHYHVSDVVTQASEREKEVHRIIWGYSSEVMAFSSRSGSSMGSLVIFSPVCRSISLILLTKLMASPVFQGWPMHLILGGGNVGS